MKNHMFFGYSLLVLTAVFSIPGFSQNLVLEPQERLITFLQTNDIHGGVEPTPGKDGSPSGGMALWSGVVSSIRQGLRSKWGDRAGMILVDAGDQFQGTLISNFNKGQLVFAAMNETGYDAVIPGNHDYDFGPSGPNGSWEDEVNDSNPDKDPRGALKRLVGQVQFPLLSANTYLKNSIVDSSGNPVEVDGNNCKRSSRSGNSPIQWEKAKRPDFLRSYLIKQAAGVRVALIGIDNPQTPETTTAANVSDLCFRDEAETYLEVQASLIGQADLFVMVVHDGNSSNEFNASKIAETLTSSGKGHALDAIVAGHTHFVNKLAVGGVPIVQSGSGGKMFGRIDLVWNTVSKSLVAEKTRFYAGIDLLPSRCDRSASDFCTQEGASGAVAYEGVKLAPNQTIQKLIDQARSEVTPLASRRLGFADGVINVDRIKESPMADSMTDALRVSSGAEIAFLNTGGLRAPIGSGPFTYEDLFKVIPFNNHSLIVGPMSARQVVALLERSMKTCGAYGALMQSGLRVVFERDCANPRGGVDPKANLLHVETLSGEVILDVPGGILPPAGKVFPRVATLDFLAKGGAGYSGFGGVPVVGDLGVFREVLTSRFLSAPAQFSSKVDGRWLEKPHSN